MQNLWMHADPAPPFQVFLDSVPQVIKTRTVCSSLSFLLLQTLLDHLSNPCMLSLSDMLSGLKLGV